MALIGEQSTLGVSSSAVLRAHYTNDVFTLILILMIQFAVFEISLEKLPAQGNKLLAQSQKCF